MSESRLWLVAAACACSSVASKAQGNAQAGSGVGGIANAGATSDAAPGGTPMVGNGGSANEAGAGAGASSGGASTEVEAGAPGAGGVSAGGAFGGAGVGAAGGPLNVPAAGTAWDSPNTGNPFLPGYFADPSIFYDAASSTFYVYSTTDGSWISYSAEPTVWYSKDFVHWRSQALSLPASWPKQSLWAPSVMLHPTNGQYYLLYAINNSAAVGTYIARANSPLGPWTNATTGTTAATYPLYKQGEMWGNSDWFDAQFFTDTDGVYMTFGGGGAVGIAKLAFASDFSVSIDNADSRMTNGSVHKFKQLTGLSNYLEGSCLFKSGSRYFMTYSNSACQAYNVQYAVASSPLGPFTHATGNIVQRDDAKHVLGPGHDSILQYGSDTYLVYHRQHYPYVDVKRQVAIDRLQITGDTISLGAQTHSGVWAGSGSLETLAKSGRAAGEVDLAFGRTVIASSESDYKGGTSGNIKETFAAQKGFYTARFAVDDNRGTRWAPSALPASLVIDLGRDQSIGRCETTFEYVRRAYKYRIESLVEAEASNAAAAQASTAWHSYADQSSNTTALSPVTDSRVATARYLRLTVLSANLPVAQAEVRTIVETDYADRVSVVELRVYQSASAPDSP